MLKQRDINRPTTDVALTNHAWSIVQNRVGFEKVFNIYFLCRLYFLLPYFVNLSIRTKFQIDSISGSERNFFKNLRRTLQVKCKCSLSKNEVEVFYIQVKLIIKVSTRCH